MTENNIEERLKRLEHTIKTMRISIIVVVVFMVANAFSHEFGSRVIFADKIKAREFVVLGEQDVPVAHLDNKEVTGLKIYAKDGSHVVLSPDALTFYQDRLNPVEKSKYD